MSIPFDSAISLLRIYPTDMLVRVWNYIRTRTFTADERMKKNVGDDKTMSWLNKLWSNS